MWCAIFLDWVSKDFPCFLYSSLLQLQWLGRSYVSYGKATGWNRASRIISYTIKMANEHSGIAKLILIQNCLKLSKDQANSPSYHFRWLERAFKISTLANAGWNYQREMFICIKGCQEAINAKVPTLRGDHNTEESMKSDLYFFQLLLFLL